MKKRKILINSISWSALERILSQIVQLFITIILARLLEPEEFGLIAIVGVFLAISQTLVDCGLSNALIQKVTPSEKDYSTIFYFNIFFGILIYVSIVLMAPTISKFFNKPMIEQLLLYLGIIPLINGLSIIHITKLTMKLNFKTQTQASLPSIVISAIVSIILAYSGYGIWAIVIQMLLNTTLNTILLWVLFKWTPLFIFSLKSFIELFTFGWKFLIASLMHTVYINLYNFIIGKRFSSTELGYFHQATIISRFPSIGFMAIITRTVFPELCNNRKNRDQLNTSFTIFLRLTFFIIFPLMIGLAILSKPLISFILSEKWLPMHEILSILFVSYSITPIMVVNNQILLVDGRTDLFLKSEIIKKICGIVVLLLSIQYSLNAICIGLIFYNCFDAAIGIYFAKKTLNIGYFEQFRSLYKIIIASILMGLVIYLSTFKINNDFIQILLGISVGFISYGVFAFLFKIKELNIFIPFKIKF